MLKRSKVSLTFLLLLLAAVVVPNALGASAATETYHAALAQIDSGKVTEAVINKATHDVKLTLSDGSSQIVIYPAADERALSRRLHSHGATVKFPRHVKKKAPVVHHRIRYIAGGVLLVVIVLGGGLFIVTSRQQTPAPPTTPPAPPAPETGDSSEADAE